MRYIKPTLNYIIYLLILFFTLELLVRFFFPNFQENLVFYDIDKNHRVSKGINTYFKTVDNVQFRVINPSDEISFSGKNQSVWFLGDSVTNGYGMEFQNNYTSLFKDLTKINNKNITVFNNAQYGSTLSFQTELFVNSVKEKLKPNDIVVFQFNFNDITEKAKYNNKKNNPEYASFLQYFFTQKSQLFRYKYLNHSALIKFLTNYSKIIIKKTSSDCKERGLFALGQYTHAYHAKGFEKKSEETWNSFKKLLLETKNDLAQNNINFYILLSPISLQVLNHSYINKSGLDLNCATIDARDELINFLKINNINFIDPLDSFNTSSKIGIAENNFEPLFFLGDTNHPTKKGHYLIALEVFKEIRGNLLDN